MASKFRNVNGLVNRITTGKFMQKKLEIKIKIKIKIKDEAAYDVFLIMNPVFFYQHGQDFCPDSPHPVQVV
jgi:hypothetical protein